MRPPGVYGGEGRALTAPESGAAKGPFRKISYTVYLAYFPRLCYTISR